MNTPAPEAVRLVIWDLDETFWTGTLTEGGITYRRDIHDIVIALARRGIISSICSKNDLAPVRALLEAEGLWDYFILPSISWGPKGPRVAAIVEAVQLRPATILFIDDNPANLAEVKDSVPGIQVALPDMLDTILENPLFTGRDDTELKRLSQYRLLQRRHEDATAASDSNAFLRNSGITVTIELDIETHIDRAIELVNRTNQLNFTKRRLPEDPEAARAEMRDMLARPNMQCGLVHVRDRYGDHGYCGFYAVRNSRNRGKSLRHFCFSCRILGMGVETWLYRRLGRPGLDVVGEVLGDPVHETGEIDWITVARPGAAAAVPEPSRLAGAPRLDIAYLRGACHMRPMSHFFASVAEQVLEGFDTTRNGRTMPLNHSLFAHYAMHGVPPAAREAFQRLGYSDEDFALLPPPAPDGQSGVWLLNFWTELKNNVYRHRASGALIPVNFAPAPGERMRKLLGAAAADARNWDAALAGVDPGTIELLREDFDFVGSTPKALLLGIMTEMIDYAPRGTQVFMLLANEMRLTEEGTLVHAPHVGEINDLVREAVQLAPRALLVDVSQCIMSDSERTVERPLKLHPAVSFRLFEEIMRAWEGGQPLAAPQDGGREVVLF